MDLSINSFLISSSDGILKKLGVDPSHIYEVNPALDYLSLHILYFRGIDKSDT